MRRILAATKPTHKLLVYFIVTELASFPSETFLVSLNTMRIIRNECFLQLSSKKLLLVNKGRSTF